MTNEWNYATKPDDSRFVFVLYRSGWVDIDFYDDGWFCPDGEPDNNEILAWQDIVYPEVPEEPEE